MILTDEEIVVEASKDHTYCQLSVDMGLWAAKAQLKKVHSWGNEPCPHALPSRPRKFCEFCWQALLEEIK